MNSRRIIFFAVLLILAVAGACSRPESDEQFVLNSGRDACGRYPFELDMSDSLASYSLSVYAVFTAGGRRFASFSGMPAVLMWKSPSGREYESDVLMPGDSLQCSTAYTKVLTTACMTGAVPVEYGRWSFCVKVPADSVSRYGMTGMGIKLKREHDGTR